MTNEVSQDITDDERAALGAAVEAIDAILTAMPEQYQVIVLSVLLEARVPLGDEIPVSAVIEHAEPAFNAYDDSPAHNGIIQS